MEQATRAIISHHMRHVVNLLLDGIARLIYSAFVASGMALFALWLYR